MSNKDWKTGPVTCHDIWKFGDLQVKYHIGGGGSTLALVVA